MPSDYGDNRQAGAAGLSADVSAEAGESMVAALTDFLAQHESVTVLSGAGCSTGSGIPDYRDEAGKWKHRRPVQFAEFVSDANVRRRYWARSFSGWRRISRARPNRAHAALAALERAGRVNCLITQNVDNLHRVAGSRNVIDLHGVLQRIRCLGCGGVTDRDTFQERLALSNPAWNTDVRGYAPDGDALLDAADFSSFSVPACEACKGTLKPDVVFFGESVPAERVQRARHFLSQSDALLVAGSSLMVFSGFRFARMAQSLGKPVAIVNRGTTRADDIATRRFPGECGQLLGRAAGMLSMDVPVKEKEQSSDGRRVDSRL